MDMEHGDMNAEHKMMKMKWKEHMALRTLTAVIVVVFVFWCGFEFGEIRASVGGMHQDYRMTQNGGWQGGGNFVSQYRRFAFTDFTGD